MPDITMCSGKGCPLRATCYRFNANPSEFVQAYFDKPPIEDGECDYHWHINDTWGRADD